jgi:DegV family protein with EDD domain
MKKKILVITADNLGIANEQINYKNVEILKYPVIIDDKEYRESQEYTARYLIDRLRKEKVTVHTQALVKEDLVEVIEANKDKFDIIINLLMSCNLSAATYQMAEIVRKEYQDIIPIINIDTKQVVSGIGLNLLMLIELIKTTKDINEIIKELKNNIKNTFTYLCLPDLNFLYRGGRIGRAKSLMGSILRIIPVVGLFGDEADSGFLPVGKGRTYQAANRIIIENVKQKMIQNEVDSIKSIVILHLEDNNSPEIVDLDRQIKISLKFRKMIHGYPRLCEAVHVGPGAWVATFIL